MTKSDNISKNIIHPKGCFISIIVVTGQTKCSTSLKMLMSGEETAYLEDVCLNGDFKDFAVYDGDWYDNTMQLEVVDQVCLEGELKFNILFFK